MLIFFTHASFVCIFFTVSFVLSPDLIHFSSISFAVEVCVYFRNQKHPIYPMVLLCCLLLYTYIIIFFNTFHIYTVQNPLEMNDAWRACEFPVNAEKKEKPIYYARHTYVEMFFFLMPHNNMKKKKNA